MLKPLVEANGLAHSGFDVQGLDVLPVLLKQGDKEVNTYMQVVQQNLDEWNKEFDVLNITFPST
jgi:hypothetical protein